VNAKYETNQAACDEEQQAARASVSHGTVVKRYMWWLALDLPILCLLETIRLTDRPQK
jgi:hypothetical protein